MKKLSGQRYENLVAVEPVGRSKEQLVLWRCRCDCGNETVIKSAHFGKTKSCGCRKGDAPWVKESYRLKRTGQKDLMAWRNHFRQYRDKARRRRLDFTLTVEQFIALTSKPCHYCGNTDNKSWLAFKGHTLIANGIDRKNSALGYVENNCLPCCARCNFMKSDLAYEEFIGACRTIAANMLH